MSENALFIILVILLWIDPFPLVIMNIIREGSSLSLSLAVVSVTHKNNSDSKVCLSLWLSAVLVTKTITRAQMWPPSADSGAVCLYMHEYLCTNTGNQRTSLGWKMCLICAPCQSYLKSGTKQECCMYSCRRKPGHNQKPEIFMPRGQMSLTAAGKKQVTTQWWNCRYFYTNCT